MLKRSAEGIRLPKVAYRADIDGLRALAVLAVLAFHAFPGRLSGGFSGVDVFFVISGFLIGSDIVSRLDDGRFSLRDFYIRRVRRIFPALLPVLVSCALFGWVTLLPDELRQLLKHLTASALFFENFQLISESGYFDSRSAFKPLLHLWSLSIEEQFYMLCPLVLMALSNRRSRLWMVGLLTLASFVLNLGLVASDSTITYYLPQTRAWQILSGVMVALMPPLTPRPGLQQLRGWIAAGGLLVLAGCFWLLGGVAGYPAAWGLLPVLGTVCLISSGNETAVARKLLSIRWLCYLGRISYPLYLWHWPLLAFLRVVYEDNPTTTAKTFALVMALGLAVATHHIIELPLRLSNRRGLQAAGLALALALVAVSAWTLNTTEVKLFRPESILNLNEAANIDVSVIHNQRRFEACRPHWRIATSGLGYCQQTGSAEPVAAILGDSHAQHVFNGVAQLDKRKGWLLLGNSSCPPLFGVQVVSSDRNDCIGLTEAAIRALSAEPAMQTVVLAFYGHYSEELGLIETPVNHVWRSKISMRDTEDISNLDPEEMVFRGLDRAVQNLTAAGKKVVLYLDVPELPFQPRDCVERPFFRRKVSLCSIPRSSAWAQQATMRRIARRLTDKHPELSVFNPIDILCDSENCAVMQEDMLVYRDTHHLSLRGSEMLGRSFLNWLGS